MLDINFEIAWLHQRQDKIIMAGIEKAFDVFSLYRAVYVSNYKKYKYIITGPNDVYFLQGLAYLDGLVKEGKVVLLDDVRLTDVYSQINGSCYVGGCVNVPIKKREGDMAHFEFSEIVRQFSGIYYTPTTE